MADKKEKSKVDLVKEAQEEVQALITTKRLELVAMLMEYKSVGGEEKEENTQESLLEVIQKNPDGIPYRFLQSAFPDAALAAGRKKLLHAGKIEQTGNKANVVLKPQAA